MDNKVKVLVTDSQTKHALAAVRNLGKHGIKSYISSKTIFDPTKLSIYTRRHFLIRKESDLKRLVAKKKIDVIIPIGYKTNIYIANHEKVFKGKAITNDKEKVKKVSIKSEFYEFLDKIGVSYPKTFIIKKIKDIPNIKYPVAVKSTIEESGKKVEYANNKKELEQILKKRLKYGTQIVQQKINGDGYGYFAICKEGKALNEFQHHRIREYPRSGGVSAVAESVKIEKMSEIGRKILKKLKWNGVAMIEFKRDEKGKFYVLEMNPKFWGSLDLAIECGMEFPYWYYLMVLGEKIRRKNYKVGVKFQWLFPEDSLGLKSEKNKIKGLGKYLRDLINPHVKKDIYWITKDPLPTMIRGVGTIGKFIKN